MTKPSAIKRWKHISTEDAAALVDDRLSRQKKQKLLAHLEECWQCQRLVAQTALSMEIVWDPNKWYA